MKIEYRHLPALEELLTAGCQEPDGHFYQCLDALPVSDTGKNGRGWLWLLNPEDYPDAFPDRLQVETACRLGERKNDLGGHLEPFPHDLRPAELYATDFSGRNGESQHIPRLAR